MSEIPVGDPSAGLQPLPRKSGTPLVLIIVFSVLGVCCFGFIVLAAILFPVFAQAREAAKKTACLSNVKQLATANLIYAADFDDRFPKAETWFDAIGPYLENPEGKKCPSLNDAGPGAYGYAFNGALSEFLSMDVERPVETPLVFESADVARGAVALPSERPIPGRHKGSGSSGSNCGYCDGHVKYVPDGTEF